MTRRARLPRPSRTDESGHPIVTVQIEKVVAEGDGLARLDDGRVVFVQGSLPGETVRAQIVRQSRDYARAVTIEVITAHRQRVEPPCPYVPRGCGGCDLQHASLSLQREIKRDIVVESLVRLGKVADPAVRSFGGESDQLPIVGSGDGLPGEDQHSGLSHRAKRTTLRVVGDTEGRPGFRRRRSHEVVAVERCLVAHDRVNDILSKLALDPDHEAVVRVGDASGESVIWTDPSSNTRGMSGNGDLIVPPIAWGPTAMSHETIFGVEFTVSASSFFQSSPGAAEALIAAVRTALGDSATWPAGAVIDAYGGVGLFSATVIPADRPGILIEVSASSCRDAAVNLAERPVRILQDSFESWTPEPAAIVIADPPRDGLRSTGVDVVAATDAAIVILVSCDPASLGRDARLLEAVGYRFVESLVVDAFPHTHHVETVSRFDKVNGEGA